MATQDQIQAARAKASSATTLQCHHAIRDCHDTLRIGGYAYQSEYAQKLWAEIDAYRERLHTLERGAPTVRRVA